MRQPSLFELVRPAHASSATTTCSTTEPLEVYDFFAGAGGFSTGAAQAGCRVVYACDNNCGRRSRRTSATTPRRSTRASTLPSDEAVAKLPTDGRRFHVHCSPPCVKLSRINTPNVVAGNAGSRGMDQAADMVEWCLEMMLASQCTSWSLEQVGDHSVQTIVERVRKRHPSRLAYAVLKLEELGVPQTRVRLIAATPALLAALLRKASRANARTPRDVIATPARHARPLGPLDRPGAQAAQPQEGRDDVDQRARGLGGLVHEHRQARAHRARQAHALRG